MEELSGFTNELYKVKELMKEMPIDLIDMGKYTEIKIPFIKKYGIDNIIRLDEETNGMFSHKIWNDGEIYLLMFVYAEKDAPVLKIDRELTYDEFKDRMYELLLHARDEEGVLTGGDFPDYDFISGEFRKEHPEIFIDANIDKNLKRKFYTGRMKAEDVRENPELIYLLQGKDLSRTFGNIIFVDTEKPVTDIDGNLNSEEPEMVNMAKYISEKIGQEEFLRICAEYGICLDSIMLSTKNLNTENIRESIEKEIYKEIKERGIKYFDNLPVRFKEKHPELFLPKSVDEKLRKEFYEGKFSFENIRENPELKEILLSKDISVGFRKNLIKDQEVFWEKLTNKEILNLAEKYGKYLNYIDSNILTGQTVEDRELAIQANIEEKILSKDAPFDEKMPEFFKAKHPEFVLDDRAPKELKQAFYGKEINDNSSIEFLTESPEFAWLFYSRNGHFIFPLIKEYPEWRDFLKGKDLRLSFDKDYDELFRRLDNTSILKLGTRDSETLRKMVINHKENTLENWYNATGRKFVPHYVVMLNFPENEIDSFLANSKKWNKLMKIDNYSVNEDSKTAILKAAYCFGVLQGDDRGFNQIIKLFTGLPKYLSPEEYFNINAFVQFTLDDEKKEVFENAYQFRDDEKYSLRINEQTDKKRAREIRTILELSDFPRIITPEKAHKIFDSFKMEYNPHFAKFFYENLEEIVSNPECTKDISTIQRQFEDIERVNSGRRLTLDIARDYIKTIAYSDIDIGNEGVAEQAKIVGYSQKDFEEIQKLYNEGETRDYSSIPRVQGKFNEYTYEMLRCDDPLALTIGKLTDCCQEIHGNGQTSMEHSVVSPDGRVFCVKDEKGRLVAQSWFWRNQYIGCFDNIEIPDRVIELYEKENPGGGRKMLAQNVLEVYKKAAQDLMQEDKRVYEELLEEGTITQEQYDALLLGKVTIGLGYNDIASAIQSDRTIHRDKEPVEVKSTERLPYIYTDAKVQYTIAEREGTVKSNLDNLYVHQDDVPVYDETNIPDSVVLTIKRMKQEAPQGKEKAENENLTQSQKAINELAEEYGLEPDNTKVMATARMTLIYSQDKDKIKIGEILSAPIKRDLTQEQKQKAENHIKNQVKRALKQLDVQHSEIDMSLLDEDKQQMLQSVVEEIEKEDNERGER